MYSFIKYFLQLIFPVFICYVQCFSKKAWINPSFDNFECFFFLMHDVFAGPTLVHYLQISNLLLYNLSIILWRKKLRFWNTRKCIKLLRKRNSLSQKRNFNHSKCLKFLVCERFYKHFFKTSKDSKIFMTYCIEIRFPLGYFSKKKLYFLESSKSCKYF